MGKNIISLFVVLVMIISCNKERDLNYTTETKNGVTYVKNSSTPQYPSAELKLQEVYTIDNSLEKVDSTQFMAQPFLYKMSEDGDLFIGDYKGKNIKRFDSSGKFLNTISREGVGPGENSGFSEFYTYNDTLFMVANNKIIQKYGFDGSFYNFSTFEDDEILSFTHLDQVDSTTITGYRYSFKKRGEELNFFFEAGLFNRRFKPINISNYDSLSLKDYREDSRTLSAKMPKIRYDHNGKFYIGFNDKNRYRVEQFNLKGEKVLDITKRYRKQEFSEEEIQNLLGNYKPEDHKRLRKFYDFKPSTYSYHIDKNSNLWIKVNDGFDIFSSEGIYIAHFDPSIIPLFDQNSWRSWLTFLDDKLLIQVAEEDDLKFTLYDYELILDSVKSGEEE